MSFYCCCWYHWFFHDGILELISSWNNISWRYWFYFWSSRPYLFTNILYSAMHSFISGISFCENLKYLIASFIDCLGFFVFYLFLWRCDNSLWICFSFIRMQTFLASLQRFLHIYMKFTVWNFIFRGMWRYPCLLLMPLLHWAEFVIPSIDHCLHFWFLSLQYLI